MWLRTPGGVVSARPMSRVRWEEEQQQEHPVQGGVGVVDGCSFL
jgi:hypothetical protein